MLFIITPLPAQDNIELQTVILGEADVSAPVSITLKDGFTAVEGCNFHASIGPNQGTNSSATIAPTSSNNTASALTGFYNNYIKTISYREPLTSVPSDGTSFEHNEIKNYYDGLGRPVQTVAIGASASGNHDIIQPILYDEFGRETIKTLPYTDTRNGSFRSGATENTVNDYYNTATPVGIISDNKAYTQITFDNSPLNRIISQTGPGSAWSNKPVQINYISNASTVQGWNISDAGAISSFNYAVNTLYITETIDEDGHITREYRDKDGQVLQKESKLGTNWLRTAYIYDDYGLLRCVVTPEATDPTTDVNLCYYYTYDSRNRMTEKKIPGGGIVKMVYDLRDRLRCTQNSEQAANHDWSFTKYDVLNRPVITGVLNYTGTTSELETAINTEDMNETRENTSTYYGYDKESFPNGTITAEVHTVTWYDNYGFITDLSLSDSLECETYNVAPYDFSTSKDISPTGRVTGTMTKVLSSTADHTSVPQTTLYSSMYYNKYGHVLRTISENHLGGKDVASTLYEDITYLPLQTMQEHHKGQENITIEKKFTYDHTGRLLATTQNVNNQGEITLNAMEYNEVGEMVKKYLHSNQTTGTQSFIQKTDYTYNIRGWLTQINEPDLSSGNDLFGMQLFYNTTSGMGSLDNSTGLFNGNIVGMKWQTKGDITRGYRFHYDDLNRLLRGQYADGQSLSNSAGFYTEQITNYDKNGNINGLNRYHNNNLVDELSYSYYPNSNQLKQISDGGEDDANVDDYPGSSQDYFYDTNGNMTTDGGRNITLAYFNTLNLPNAVDFGNNNRIFYHYTATGAKMMKHVKVGTTDLSTTHYIGNIVYENGQLKYIITDEGRLVPFGTSANRKFLYEYNIKDHLGNSRVTFMGTDLGGAVDVLQTTSYYPFGLTMVQNNGNIATGYQKNKYLYNGKEIQDDNLNGKFFGLMDYGARFYDPQIGRWSVIDPKAELYRRWSPYCYGIDNPLRFIDPDGMGIIDEVKKIGSYFVKGYVGTFKAMGHAVTHPGKTAKAAINNSKEAIKHPGPALVKAGLNTITGGTYDQVIEPNVPMVTKLAKGDINGAAEAAGNNFANATVQVASLGVGAVAGKALGALSKTGTTSTKAIIPDNAFVVRGGNCTTENLTKGMGMHPEGVYGVSTQSAANVSVKELASSLPYAPNKIGVTTAGDVRAIGGDVISTSGAGYHATLTNLLPKEMSELFNVISNPAK